MKLPWVDPDTPLPPVECALSDPDGLLAAGADLSVARLTEAYSRGIFPWYAEGEPVLWWSPDPRMVLACEDFAVSHSLAKRLRQLARQEATPHPRVEVRVDTAFEQVLRACAAPRDGRPGTWITDEMRDVYAAWHRAGVAHSVETWVDGRLSAGLYGVSLGAMFYGESMFTRVTDGSKIALAHLVRFLSNHGVPWIDCQQQTRHLASLGARPVPRAQFVARVAELVTRPGPPWRPGRLDTQGALHALAPA
ncbi:leucyl/phenylalanyl-tRNA--protein transferase [Bordetella genomosp. 9]|uniref:Leucyl/phenylalanyl-tRNA--protein transferase n=1 Tax=Bordetella genomosp. 9 TaxID=1416803 RepID=A0A1W6Z497_9BORD|nr:leucyl/phenylalanyl-tRNA--protein transferase [Bordetella genomosp. 9]ARP87643.1 leucyl/phenylalanyl-tRNA--protein transferase [Bordetella genomosp. 9]ARP91614.1 leucyl/phenylalanyl-tRNA--protein transferase [Bordetella genomosp. 9]